MPEIMTGSGYFSLVTRLEQMRHEVTWAEFILRHKEQLETIADITRLGVLWQSPRFTTGHALRLHLRYTGKARAHKDAVADLGRIMEALHCPSLCLEMVSRGGESRPEAEYHGECWVGQTRLELRLRVSWLPEGCEINISREHREMRTTRYYSVYCDRR